MSRYSVRDGQMWWGEHALGPAHLIYVDGHQDLASILKRALPYEHLVVRKLGVGDYVFKIANSDLVAGIEEKKLEDLVNSTGTRRLQRQLRHLRESVDVPICAVRLPYSFTLNEDMLVLPLIELLKWQAVGGMATILPAGMTALMSMLEVIQANLQPGRGIWSVLAGTDKRQEPPGMSKLVTQLHRLRLGIGPATGAKLEARYANLVEALSAPDEEWLDLGVPRHVLKKRAEL